MGGGNMTIEEILAGESKNVEFKVQRPDKSIKYMKTVVAFANGKGGRIVFGIDDKTREFRKMLFFWKSTQLPMRFQIAVSQQLSQMCICRT